MGRADMLKTLRPELLANERFGVITVKDILVAVSYTHLTLPTSDLV